MTTLTIRRLDDRVKERLRKVAAEHGHSMEEEARQILGLALLQDANERWARDHDARDFSGHRADRARPCGAVRPDERPICMILVIDTNVVFDTMRKPTLAFTADSAVEYATLAADRESIGRPIGPFDAMIAATCREVGATLATRNTRDFADCGVTVFNPFD